MRTHAYTLAGLRVESDFAIPELPRPRGKAAADVRIRLGRVPNRLRGALAHPMFEATPTAYLLRGAPMARYLVRDGREVTVAPARGADMRAVRVFLLGPCLRALCHQRGLVPLRASAVEVAGEAIALAGPSMAGKSTIAARLGRAGFPVLADDVCIVGFDAADRPIVLPSVPRLRVWRDALRRLGEEPKGPPDRSGIPRYSIAIPPVLAPRPLARIYLLDRQPLPKARGQRLPTLLAARALAILSSVRALTEPMGRDTHHFSLVLKLLAAGVEVHSFPRGTDCGKDAAKLARMFARR